MCDPPYSRPKPYSALVDYLEFRHVIRNVYSFNLRPERVAALVQGLHPTFDLTRRDLLAFAEFLEHLATADEGQDAEGR